jgi:uncharacterized protein (DUF58 family)
MASKSYTSRSAATRPTRSVNRSRLDPETLMRIKDLQLRARAVVEGFMSGLHRSPYHGFSVEFTEYRQYSPGDDLRYLDWRLFARSDRYYIKRFEDETNLRCHLLVDLSRSMSYSSMTYTKSDYARTMAATFGYFLSLQRDAVGLMTFDERMIEYLPARFRPGHLHRLMMALERPEGGRGTNLREPLEQVAKVVRKRGLIVLISDLLAPLESVEECLGYLCTRGHDVVLFRVLDPGEVEFPFEEATLFLDLEDQRQLYVDPGAVRGEYLEKFRRHSARIQEICGNLGIELFEVTIDRPLDLALHELLQARQRPASQRATRPARRRMGAGS